MRIKTTVILSVLMLAVAVQAQVLSELTTVSAPAAEPELGLTVSQPEPAEERGAPVAETVSAPAAEVVVPPAAVETVTISPEPANDATMKNGLISLSLKEVELSNVIRLFATLSDANIIVPNLGADVSAVKVDVNLKDVEWKPALQSILETTGLELYEKTPGSEVYSVRKKPADAPAPMDVKTFKLNYATVAGVSEMITAMVPEPGKISVFPARNTIVVQSTPENIAEVQAMINAVDLPRQQVFIEAKFLELNDSASEKLGIDWQVLGGYGVGINGIGGTYEMQKMYDMNGNQYQDADQTTYSLIPGTTDYSVSQAAPTFTPDPTDPGGYIQNPGPPVTFTPDPTDPGGYIRTDGVTTYTADPRTGIYDAFTKINEPTVATTLGATLSASDFNLVLAALKETGGTKVVSNPKIIVANEETAQIYIGTKEPNIRQETTQVENTAPIKTFNLDEKTPYFEYGIKLDVTPTVNTAENISVVIKPTLSRKLGDKVVGDTQTQNSFPITTEKTINTRFALSSGQTAAIGGLTESEDHDVSRKVPLLGSLPLIGRFFSYSEKSSDQTETIIFVTIGLANPEHIDMETGLPQESSLAMRQTAKMKADREIKAEELKISNQLEAERSQAAIKKLQAVEQKRLEKAAE